MNGTGRGYRGAGRAIVLALGMIAGCKAQEQVPAARGTTPSAAAGDSAAKTTTAAGRAPLRVLFVGTSLTAGLGLEPDSAFPALIQRKADSAGLRVQVVNAGVSGETSAGALRRIDWVLREPADVVVLETGANDGLRALRVDSTRANIEAIVRRIKTALPSARVVLVQMEAPPNLGPRYTSAFHDMFPAVARAEGVALAPFLLTDVAGVSRLNQADGIHPNDAGARIVAETVWRSLEPELRTAAGAAGAG